MYGYVEAAFGPGAGFVGGVLMWLSCVLAAGGIAAALGGALSVFAPPEYATFARDAVIVVVLGGVAVLNSIGVKFASRLIGWATALKILPLLLFVGVGALYASPAKMLAGATPEWNAIGGAIILALFALQGMETPLGASGEVANPARNLPRALFMAMIAVTVLYVAIQLVAQGLLGAGLAKSGDRPLELAFSVIDPRLGALMVVAAAVSRSVWLASDSLGAPRILFAFARDGFLPGFLGKVSAKGHSPANAIWVHALIAMAFALFGTFKYLAELSVLADVGLYIMACAAAWFLRRRDVALAGTPLRLPGLGLWVVLSIVSMAAVIALAERDQIIALFTSIAALIVIYGVMRLFRPRKRG
jgi:amino acid transporter